MKKKKGLNILGGICKGILLISILIYTIFPFIWLLLTSLKGQKELYKMPLQYLPETFYLGNYIDVLQIGNFLRYLGNSILIAVVTAALAVIISAMSAYILATMQFKSRPAIMIVFLMTQMLPTAVGFAPMYVLMSRLGMVDQLSTVIFLLLGSQIPFGTILLIGFMKGVPRALEEAALIDGCSRIRSFVRIVLPMVQSGLFTVFIFAFLACWNDVYTSVLYIDSDLKKTLTVAIYSMSGTYDTNWGNVAAGTLIAILPAIILFAVMKDMFVENIAAGAVKE